MASRVATRTDVERVLAMMASFNAHERIPFDAATFRARLQTLVDSPALGGVVLFEGGYAVVTFGFDLEYGGRDAFLTELWVEPSGRRRGLGRAGLAAAEEYAREQGAHALHLLVRFDNREARALYDSAGYEAEPRAVMTKRL